MSGVGRQAGQLGLDILRARPVHSEQRRTPGNRQTLSKLLDYRRPARHVTGVVEDRVAEKDDVAHRMVLTCNLWFRHGRNHKEPGVLTTTGLP